jgi:hypothetical protein
MQNTSLVMNFYLRALLLICALLAETAASQAGVNELNSCNAIFRTSSTSLNKYATDLGSLMSIQSTQNPEFSPLRTTKFLATKTLPEGGVIQIGPNLFRASIEGIRFELLSAPESSGIQQQSNWCWAACIKMVLNYYNIPITQAQIVRYGFGELIDRAGGYTEILGTLNNWFATLDNRLVKVQATLLDPTKTTDWVQLVVKGQPLIVGLADSFIGASGHAYVIKAVDFSILERGLIIQTVTLANPWPTSQSEITLSWQDFSRRQLGLYVIY